MFVGHVEPSSGECARMFGSNYYYDCRPFTGTQTIDIRAQFISLAHSIRHAKYETIPNIEFIDSAKPTFMNIHHAKLTQTNRSIRVFSVSAKNAIFNIRFGILAFHWRVRCMYVRIGRQPPLQTTTAMGHCSGRHRIIIIFVINEYGSVLSWWEKCGEHLPRCLLLIVSTRCHFYYTIVGPEYCRWIEGCKCSNFRSKIHNFVEC